MDIERFTQILQTFADSAEDVDTSKGVMVAQINEEMIEAKLLIDAGDVSVKEADNPALPAYRWITERVARLDLLADRILDYTDEEPSFVSPSGRLLDVLELSPEDTEETKENAATAILDILHNQLAGTTSALYLTSDAGEGKTTLIDHLARRQAERYKADNAEPLIVPIKLGGRPFMRLDDVIVAELSNKLRFQRLFYDSFIQLVQLGAVIPALDGFEEMLMESSSGDANSALGNLMNDLSSSGRVIIAARKAYFEFHSFAAQARVFDTIGSNCVVSFSRIAIDRWDRNKFLEYVAKRGLSNGEDIYAAVTEILEPDHPILTRAVLVKRLVDVAATGSIGDLVARLGQKTEDYFFQFVDAIIEREAESKWIDSAGEAAQPLLTVSQHHKLLEAIAKEMWVSRTDALRRDYIDLVTEMFAAENGLSPRIATQIKERILQHSLLVVAEQTTKRLSFDHEDFRQFFLGRALGLSLCSSDHSDSELILKAGALSNSAINAAVHRVVNEKHDLKSLVERLNSLAAASSTTSYIHQNVGALAIGLLSELDDSFDDSVVVKGMFFPEDSLQSRILTNVVFANSTFAPTSLRTSVLSGTRFVECTFTLLEFADDESFSFELENCSVEAIHLRDRDERCYEPSLIARHLQRCGIKIIDAVEQLELDVVEDPRREVAERALRAFTRETMINENAFKLRLGTRSSLFFDEILPSLCKNKILLEDAYHGKKKQSRFRLGVPMKAVERAIRMGNVSLEEFIAALSSDY